MIIHLIDIWIHYFVLGVPQSNLLKSYIERILYEQLILQHFPNDILFCKSAAKTVYCGTHHYYDYHLLPTSSEHKYGLFYPKS